MPKTIEPTRAGPPRDGPTAPGLAHTSETSGEGEVRLRRILDTVVAFVGTLTPSGVITEANEPALAAASLKREDVVGQPVWDGYWFSYSPQVQAQLRDDVRRAASGETIRRDVDIRVKEGELLTIDLQIAPTFDDQGNVVELIPSGIDITERKQAEERLRRSYGTFSSLVQNAPFGVYLIDAQFRMAQVSAGSRKVFDGVQPLLGRYFAEVMRTIWPEPFASEAIARFRHTLKTGEPFQSHDTTEQRANTAELETYDWQLERVSLPDGQFGVVCYFYDLTPQRRAEAAVRRSEARLSQILNNVNAFIGLIDTGSIVTEVNSTALAASGVARHDVIGKRFEDTPWWASSAETRDRVADIVKRGLAGETVRCDLPYKGADGDDRWVDFQIAPVVADDGKILAVVPSGLDITVRKAAEEHREMLMGELNHRIKNTLATIQAMASHTLRSAPNPQAFRETFNGRLRAIASAHEILFENADAGASLTDLISRQVGPYGDLKNNKVRLDGPVVRLNPTNAHALGLELHEFATNAAKYGALSNSLGHVEITWTLRRSDGRQFLELSWSEHDGAAVQEPDNKGFGSRLIEQTITQTLEGELELSYGFKGFTAFLKVPMDSTA